MRPLLEFRMGNCPLRPLLLPFLFRASQNWNLFVESQRKDASFPIATLRNFRVLLVQTAVHKLSAVHLKMDWSQLLCRAHIPMHHIGTLIRWTACFKQAIIICVRFFINVSCFELLVWLDLSNTHRYVGGAITVAVVIFRDLLEICLKHIRRRIAADV